MENFSALITNTIDPIRKLVKNNRGEELQESIVDYYKVSDAYFRTTVLIAETIKPAIEDKEPSIIQTSTSK